jgi:hypothetical protein
MTSMWRYYAAATAVVLALLVGITAWQHPDVLHIRLGATTVPAPPKPQPPDTPGATNDRALLMTAPWVLSALPECLLQTSESTGPLGYVRSKLPAGAQPVADGTSLAYGPCTILVAGDELIVTRGPDRFTVPPHVQLFRAGGDLALLRVSGARGELRVYTTHTTVQ